MQSWMVAMFFLPWKASDYMSTLATYNLSSWGHSDIHKSHHEVLAITLLTPTADKTLTHLFLWLTDWPSIVLSHTPNSCKFSDCMSVCVCISLPYHVASCLKESPVSCHFSDCMSVCVYACIAAHVMTALAALRKLPWHRSALARLRIFLLRMCARVLKTFMWQPVVRRERKLLFQSRRGE